MATRAGGHFFASDGEAGALCRDSKTAPCRGGRLPESPIFRRAAAGRLRRRSPPLHRQNRRRRFFPFTLFL